MHSYLRAVGFSELNSQSELDKLVESILESPSQKNTVLLERQTTYVEITKSFSENMGIALRGEYDEMGKFHMESYYPYYYPETVSTKEEILFNKKVDSESYTGMCDDIRIGVSLIFYLQNILDYIKLNNQKEKLEQSLSVRLVGLSLEGKVLLGLDKQEPTRKDNLYESKHRNQLIAEARQGNQEAIDSLTIEDIDLYTMITKRSKYEDIYSIVESSFIPYGSESDNYSVIGTIIESKTLVNERTNEQMYSLLLECNDLKFQVCINKKDLQGEPLVGRRFKGVIWMQGMVEFDQI